MEWDGKGHAHLLSTVESDHKWKPSLGPANNHPKNLPKETALPPVKDEKTSLEDSKDTTCETESLEEQTIATESPRFHRVRGVNT